jgi:hypothetical protein
VVKVGHHQRTSISWYLRFEPLHHW